MCRLSAFALAVAAALVLILACAGNGEASEPTRPHPEGALGAAERCGLDVELSGSHPGILSVRPSQRGARSPGAGQPGSLAADAGPRAWFPRGIVRRAEVPFCSDRARHVRLRVFRV